MVFRQRLPLLGLPCTEFWAYPHRGGVTVHGRLLVATPHRLAYAAHLERSARRARRTNAAIASLQADLTSRSLQGMNVGAFWLWVGKLCWTKEGCRRRITHFAKFIHFPFERPH